MDYSHHSSTDAQHSHRLVPLSWSLGIQQNKIRSHIHWDLYRNHHWRSADIPLCTYISCCHPFSDALRDAHWYKKCIFQSCCAHSIPHIHTFWFRDFAIQIDHISRCTELAKIWHLGLSSINCCQSMSHPPATGPQAGQVTVAIFATFLIASWKSQIRLNWKFRYFQRKRHTNTHCAHPLCLRRGERTCRCFLRSPAGTTSFHSLPLWASEKYVYASHRGQWINKTELNLSAIHFKIIKYLFTPTSLILI